MFEMITTMDITYLGLILSFISDTFSTNITALCFMVNIFKAISTLLILSISLILSTFETQNKTLWKLNTLN